MKLTYSRVVAITLLTICALVLAVAATVSVMEAIEDAYIEAHQATGTSEGPDGDYTLTWYMSRALDVLDSFLNQCCKLINREDLFFMWRVWLMEEHNIVYY